MLRLKPLIGSVFYAGFLPNAPGTWGSFFALFPIYFIGTYAPWYGIVLFIIACSWLTVWVSEECEQKWGKDPSPVVMDEFAGQGMAFIFIPLQSTSLNVFLLLALGFIFFRFFDIVKPLGVHELQTLPGGWGILIDDLLAGFYAFICLVILIILVAVF
jgi:phosphatidylglycerophosphatase A